MPEPYKCLGLHSGSTPFPRVPSTRLSPRECSWVGFQGLFFPKPNWSPGLSHRTSGWNPSRSLFSWYLLRAPSAPRLPKSSPVTGQLQSLNGSSSTPWLAVQLASPQLHNLQKIVFVWSFLKSRFLRSYSR